MKVGSTHPDSDFYLPLNKVVQSIFMLSFELIFVCSVHAWKWRREVELPAAKASFHCVPVDHAVVALQTES